MKNDMKSTKHDTEKVILLAFQDKRIDEATFQSTVDELESLAATSKLEVIEIFTQKRDRPDQQYYFGKGKIEEVIEYIELNDLNVNAIIANDELTTGQSKHLDELFNTKIIDRTQLILEIFAQRASSREGQLQVELAQLDYLLPRLSGHGKSLSRLGGGIGTRGPGETKLETDRRHIRTRMNEIKHQLETIVSHRSRYRERRQHNQAYQVALIGYTNAGKSSWFNQLSNDETFEQDLLFATLDPKSRAITINNGFNVIISDTVGFIQKLPTTLIAAFKSTLEEAKYAQLLIHVVDASHPHHMEQYETVMSLVNQLEMGHIPMLVVFNKKDMVQGAHLAVSEHSIFVSAKNVQDKVIMKEKLVQMIEETMEYYEMTIPSSNADQLYWQRTHTLVETMDFDEASNSYLVKGYKQK
ncbi:MULTISPECIES: GTPase HflX [Mammaliicoccus]|uniref:GTPase HflX n=1 Tax=Mammaliicoccus fleurettii TaxID=150056 RepID=A0ABS5MQV9_9STAP|nr:MULTISPECIES: GTPase HflX [Mammaliicoccus]MBL0848440.1 GTPase HflX [Mammaliicoccus fleurettii]MBO3062670.1 GTPase HflX [Mammaliicoccus fleurettii]MBS3672806.1 GTPase HflX [Mammaliicoccus fleurettii]MBS3698254.1 GTPase HflX [Mammaliicoccus fleurettii]MBW0764610.1 GTPase HflX [Mammaliicoccus fleurettii]